MGVWGHDPSPSDEYDEVRKNAVVCRSSKPLYADHSKLLLLAFHFSEQHNSPVDHYPRASIDTLRHRRRNVFIEVK